MLLNTQYRPIKKLSPILINQIKAGEIVERPMNVLKELIENSLDANATSISIVIKGNGIDLISVKDNGHGIKFEDMPKAFERHSTSKIEKYEQLFDLYSFGFRGEALASISSVSKIEVQSTHQSGTSLFKLVANQDTQHQKIDYPSNTGTHIKVMDLFFNTPVRLNFINSKKSEKNALLKVFNIFCLSRPDVSFTLNMDDEFPRKFNPLSLSASSFKHRFFEIIYKNKSYKDNQESLQSVEFEINNTKVNILFSVEATKSPIKKQFIFINSRYIEDRQIHFATVNSLSKFWGINQVGHYALFITIPHEEVDINVHPHKTQAKFKAIHYVTSIISSSINRHIQELLKSSNNHELVLGQEKYKSVSSEESSNLGYNTTNSSIREAGPSSSQSQSPLELTIAKYKSCMAVCLELDADYFFLYTGNKKYIVKTRPFLCSYFNVLYKSFSLEHDTIALLVGTPIELSLQNKEIVILKLSELGITLTPLSTNRWVLKTIPRFFLNLDFIDWIKELSILLDKKSNMISKSDQHQTSGPFISSSNVDLKNPHVFTEEIFNNVNISELRYLDYQSFINTSSFIKEIEDLNWDKIFNER